MQNRYINITRVQVSPQQVQIIVQTCVFDLAWVNITT
jgi:hypothetical protein